jgi:hypothetical protein
MVVDPWLPITTYLVMNGFLPPQQAEDTSHNSLEQMKSPSQKTGVMANEEEVLVSGPVVDPNELSIDD